MYIQTSRLLGHQDYTPNIAEMLSYNPSSSFRHSRDCLHASATTEGEKKYSPPFGTIQSVGRGNDAPVLLGSTPVMERTRTPSTPFCPMIGSKPGTMGSLSIGKVTLFAQPVGM